MLALVDIRMCDVYLCIFSFHVLLHKIEKPHVFFISRPNSSLLHSEHSGRVHSPINTSTLETDTTIKHNEP
jgi:hypothetical protein